MSDVSYNLGCSDLCVLYINEVIVLQHPTVLRWSLICATYRIVCNSHKLQFVYKFKLLPCAVNYYWL